VLGLCFCVFVVWSSSDPITLMPTTGGGPRGWKRIPNTLPTMDEKLAFRGSLLLEAQCISRNSQHSNYVKSQGFFLRRIYAAFSTYFLPLSWCKKGGTCTIFYNACFAIIRSRARIRPEHFLSIFRVVFDLTQSWY
jgi:hypothetical protein